MTRGCVLLEAVTRREPPTEGEDGLELEAWVRRAFKEERPLSELAGAGVGVAQALHGDHAAVPQHRADPGEEVAAGEDEGGAGTGEDEGGAGSGGGGGRRLGGGQGGGRRRLGRRTRGRALQPVAIWGERGGERW